MKNHHEIEAELDDLFDDSDWAEHETFPVEDWIYEVRNHDTRLGYRDWLYNMLANQED